MPELVLASTSPYRRELLARLGLSFEAATPDCAELALPGEAPEALVRRLSEAKARSVAERFPKALIIGSDQVASLDGEILGKPGGREKAIAQLTMASGRCVTFYTGLSLVDAARRTARTVCEPFHVHFRTLSPEQIARYVDHERPFDCAGSFKSEGYGVTLFTRLSGEDPTALVGLPLIRLVQLLGEAGVALP
ncbi:MAG: Maf-like protein [Gammaproteobacteria bacterium]|jgi:MAF protein|nr:Maf-like protein [Gammaproteobacteria bacterium]